MTGPGIGWRLVAGCAALIAYLVLTSAQAQEAAGPVVQNGAANAQQQAYCRQLERQLAPDWQQAATARDSVPKIESQLARADQQVQRGQAMAEKADCFDYFLFSKSWRDTPQCRQLHQQIDDGQRAMADLERQRSGASNAQDRAARQDALVSELARNHCGNQYEAALQRRTGGGTAGFWSDNESQSPGGAVPGFESIVPGSTFRTICVRMCDGYYFPVSFATTPDHLQHDAQVCQSQCGGPAKLYYYPNPGGEVQQAVGLDGTPYTALQNAFRYRKELVSSCTCRGPGDGSEAVADTQPMQQPAQDAGGKAGGVVVDPNADPQPLGEFGTMNVEPAPGDGQTN